MTWTQRLKTWTDEDMLEDGDLLPTDDYLQSLAKDRQDSCLLAYADNARSLNAEACYQKMLTLLYAYLLWMQGPGLDL